MNSISSKTRQLREILNTISDRMIATRPEVPLQYYSFVDCESVQFQRQSFIHIDFSKLCNSFSDGDIGVAKTYLKCGSSSAGGLVLALQGRCCAYLNGIQVAKNLSADTLNTYPITLKQGLNELILRVCATDDIFRCKFCVSVNRYIGLWANDYLFHTKPVLGTGSGTGLILYRPYSTGQTDPATALEQEPPVLTAAFSGATDGGGDFDFTDLGAKGHCAYAWVMAKGSLSVCHSCPVSIWIDGQNMYQNEVGTFSCTLEKERHILIKCIKGADTWGFHAKVDGQLRNGLLTDFDWLWIDGFGGEDASLSSPFAPEFNLQFTAPYRDYFNGSTFWKLNYPGAHLRAGLESIFFGQWFYALLVGVHGLNICACRLGNDQYVSYFIKHMKLICSLYDLSCYDYSLFGNTELYPRGAVLDNLDAIGTIGMNLCDYFSMTNDNAALPLISRLADAALHNIPRFEDGTYYRIDTMWADDIYMSCPFLVRAGRILGRPEYFDEVIRQLRGFKRKLWIPEEKLFSHIYFPDTKLPNRIPWGRGNGWMSLTLTEVLRFLPDSYTEKAEIKAMFQEFCQGLLQSLDREKYIFHQVLNRPESYAETSCSAMFIIAFVRGYQYGLLNESYVETAKKVWQTLTETAIDADGNVYHVCMGSGCSMENEYYFNIPTKVNDDHGTGIVLLAGSELLSLKQ